MTSAATNASASYAVEVARLLWPEPWGRPQIVRDRHRGGLAHRDAYVFPSPRNPRLLVPADLPASSTMLRRLGSDRSRWTGPVRTVLERSVRSPAFALARWPMVRIPGTDPGADSIEQHLARCVGRPVRVGVMLGTRRVNQKPVLQVFGLDGTLVAYAKVGHNTLTAALVRREAQSLSFVGERHPASFRVPRLLDLGQWGGCDVLVISPLPADKGRAVTAKARLAAMREVATLAGVRSATLATSDFWCRLRDDTRRLADTPRGSALPAAVEAIEGADGSASLDLGGWHGDWGDWNMAVGDGALQLWDWERYDPDVPVGFDGVHFLAQSVRPGERDQDAQERHFLGSVAQALTAVGVRPADHSLTLRLYLLEIAVRYVDALTHGSTPELERRTAWVVSLLERQLEQHRPTLSRGRP